jgi:hypothetical protein
MLSKKLNQKFKVGSRKQLLDLTLLALIFISSLIIIQLLTIPWGNTYAGQGLFKSGQSIANYPKDSIYLYPFSNDSDVDNSKSIGSHSYFPNLAIAGEYDTIKEGNTANANIQILVPNGQGSDTELYAYSSIGSEDNWECTNSFDGNTSYVYYNEANWKRDLYNIADPNPTGSGNINWVRVGISVITILSYPTQKGDAEILVLAGSTLFSYSGYNNIPTSYTNYSVLLEKSPSTDDSWTWDELENLQVGVALRLRNTPQSGDMVRCTFVWVEVNYTIPNYELDLELQWRGIPPTTSNSDLCIKTGVFSGNEKLSVEYWNGGNWIKAIDNLVENQWNNVSLNINDSVLTIRFKGLSETQDIIQDYWEIDLCLISINYNPQAIYLEQLFLLLFGDFLFGGGSQPILPYAAFIVGSAVLVSILGLVIRYSYLPGENVSFRRKRIRQLEEARKRVQKALEDIGDGGTS